MRILVDSNVLIAALIKDSAVRKALLSDKHTFYYPHFTLKELNRYRNLIILKSNLSDSDINEVFNTLVSVLHFVTKKSAKRYMKSAYQAMKDIDEKDAPILAAALAIKADGILTFDEDFKRQKLVKVLSIRDL